MKLADHHDKGVCLIAPQCPIFHAGPNHHSFLNAETSEEDWQFLTEEEQGEGIVRMPENKEDDVPDEAVWQCAAR